MSDLQLPEIEDASPLEEVDAAIADVLVPHAEHALVTIIGELSEFSDQEPLYAAAAGVIATGLVMRDGKTVQAGTQVLAAHLLATGLRGIVKRLVDRTRPDVAARKGEYELSEGQRFESDFNSFPSGHSAGAFAFARAVGRNYPAARQAALGAASAASAAQVLRSKHFITDVVAGIAIGLVAEAAVDRLVQRAARV